MEQLPDGISVGITRHTESRRNHKSNAARDAESFPVHLPDSYEDHLTIVGRVQSEIVAEFLTEKMGGVDLVICSTSNRAIEAADPIVRRNPRCNYVHLHQLVERRRDPADEVWRLLMNLVQSWVRVERGKNPGQLITVEDAFKNLGVVLEKYVPVVVEWQNEQEQLKLDLQNYSLFGESAESLDHRTEEFLPMIFGHIRRSRAKKVVIVSHAKTIIATRKKLERLGPQALAEIYEANGPPFPCNGGSTFYESRKGKLVRVSEPCVLPPSLEARGRRVVPMLSAEDFARIVTEILSRRSRQRKTSRYEYPTLADMLVKARVATPRDLENLNRSAPHRRKRQASGPRR